MQKISCIALITSLLMLSGNLFSQKWKQYRYEATAGISEASLLGDIGGSATRENMMGIKDMRLNTAGLSLHGGFRYRIVPKMAVRANINYLLFRGTDANSQYPNRALSFQSNAFEASVQYEYSLISDINDKISFARFNRKGRMISQDKYNLYVFGGIGGLYYSPNLTGSYTVRNPGVFNESGFTVALPLGIGLKYNIQTRISLLAEFSGRYTLSDKIDGYSSKYSKHQDLYYLMSFGIAYQIKTTRNGYPDILPKSFVDWYKNRIKKRKLGRY